MSCVDPRQCQCQSSRSSVRRFRQSRRVIAVVPSSSTRLTRPSCPSSRRRSVSRYASVPVPGTSDVPPRVSPRPWIFRNRAVRRIARDVALRRRQLARERPQRHDHLRSVFRLLCSHFAQGGGERESLDTWILANFPEFKFVCRQVKTAARSDRVFLPSLLRCESRWSHVPMSISYQRRSTTSSFLTDHSLFDFCSCILRAYYFHYF